MARSLSPYKIAESIWRNKRVKCPVCTYLSFDSWYCPNCGLPKNNSEYIIYEDKIYHFGPSHFRKIGNIEEYKLCSKCYTPNPSDANFCRSCRENIATQARDKNGHGWIDLGLSVLWSAESLPNRFLWNDNTTIFDNHDDKERLRIRELYIKSNRGESEGKDAATSHLGKKWRTPTKKEYEELITKCKWEKYIIPSNNQFALKGIGPNGNSIIFPIDPQYEPNYRFGLWSSTQENNKRAYQFVFSEVAEKVENTLTAKQKKRIEFMKSNDISFKVDVPRYFIGSFSSGFRSFENIEETRKRTYPEYEKVLEQQRKILDAMGDDSQEIENNRKADLKKIHNLWLKSPIKIITSTIQDIDFNGTIRIISRLKTTPGEIRPVADKKWQGKL